MHIRATYLFDNKATVFFAVFMSFWGKLNKDNIIIAVSFGFHDPNSSLLYFNLDHDCYHLLKNPFSNHEA